MLTSYERAEAKKRAREAAQQIHEDLGHPLDVQVPIDAIIHEDFEDDITLSFGDFPNKGRGKGQLLGLYVPPDEEYLARIIIHRKIPRFLQRFTLAHELGHYILEHERAFDSEEDIEGPLPETDPDAVEEIEAQSFAANFLMPLELINTCFARRGILNGQRRITEPLFTPESAYQLSLELGVNYIAALTHLANIGRLAVAKMTQLRQLAPKAIKERLALQVALSSPWADVWQLDRRDVGRQFTPREGDLIRLDLPLIPGLSLPWEVQVVERDGESETRSLRMDFVDTQEMMGANGQPRLHSFWQAAHPGQCRIQALPQGENIFPPVLIDLVIQNQRLID